MEKIISALCWVAFLGIVALCARRPRTRDSMDCRVLNVADGVKAGICSDERRMPAIPNSDDKISEANRTVAMNPNLFGDYRSPDARNHTTGTETINRFCKEWWWIGSPFFLYNSKTDTWWFILPWSQWTAFGWCIDHNKLCSPPDSPPVPFLRCEQEYTWKLFWGINLSGPPYVVKHEWFAIPSGCCCTINMGCLANPPSCAISEVSPTRG